MVNGLCGLIVAASNYPLYVHEPESPVPRGLRARLSLRPSIRPLANTTLTDTCSSLIVDGLHGRLAGPFDLGIEGGECVALSGPSGVGKSLLLRMIADLEPARGRVELDGVDRDRMPAPAFRRQVTYVAADAGWWADIVADHMAYPERARALLPGLGLADALFEAPVATLSTGQRQRLALVRAISQHPRFLLLDEPTSALDPEATAQVEALLARLREQGTGLLVVTHDAAQAVRIATRRLRMTPGGLEDETP